ncbi:MAG TPA: tRNA dihydrouridine(20/20a) synthase DusA [Steroidobacteraceae bacterium]|nr:tRNA dihydrouridine(20/20a) synthase DusA [Steroidobacteraceae bacterium]
METPATLDRRLSVAPMMDWTDRHCRFFLRQFSPHALLYTEMITAAAILHGDRRRLLEFDAAEHPVALQLGGSDPEELARAAEIGAAEGYNEINLNVGCPSDRVQSGTFGACLMAEPERVADCVAAMQARVAVPVTVKARIGIERGAGAAARGLEYTEADEERLHDFVSRVARGGARIFAIHARKAVLSGFSPKDNREIPPLRYDVVMRLKRRFGALTVVANGGVRDAAQAAAILAQVDGVMIGREAYHHPYLLSELEGVLHPHSHWRPPARAAVLETLAEYAARQLAAGQRLHSITRHVLGLFAGQPGARTWRRYFAEAARPEDAGVDVLTRAIEVLRREAA